jgi:hypothetical protein
MDSASTAASRNESTWTVDLAGLGGLILKFWAKTGSSELPHGPPPVPFTSGADFDGVAISADGTVWYEVQSLRNIGSAWRSFTVDLDRAIASFGLAYNSTFKIRFNQYDSNGTPGRGISIDDIEIVSSPSTYAMALTGPAQLSEVSPQTLFGVTLPFAVPTDTVLTLRTSSPEKVAIPGQLLIPAGRTSSYFKVQPIRDFLPDGHKAVTLSVASDIFATGTLSFILTDC